MKIFLVSFFSFLLISSCSDSYDSVDDILNGTWNVANVSGGFAGMDQDFESGTITWTFDASSSMLTVANNNVLVDVIYDGLDSGTYSYSILKIDSKNHLVIDDQEFAGISFANELLFLNQNEISTGSGADGFSILLAQ